MTALTKTLLFHTLALSGLLLAACSGQTGNGATGGVVAGATCATEGSQAAATDGCNTCSCSGDTWSCTERDCFAACDDGDREDDGCNVCACSDGAWSCTRAVCGEGGSSSGSGGATGEGGGSTTGGTTNDGGSNSSAGTSSQGGGSTTGGSVGTGGGNSTCRTGDVRDSGCNTCSCQNGQWLCSAMPCVEPACPAPRHSDDICPAVVVIAKNPETGSCCEYDDPCRAPVGWDQFNSMDECGARPTPNGCVPGTSRPADDGCNTCTCVGDGGWACTERACPPPGETGCGARLGDTCSSSEYCAYQAGQYCGAADASAVCLPRPVICTSDYSPVCGCDGVTYSNACSAGAAGTGVLDVGPCAVSAMD